jgi:chromate transporter
VALMGWGVGLNAGGGPGGGWHAYGLALLGMSLTMVGMLLPSSIVTYLATRWAHRNRQRRSVRAFKAGMAPIVVALLIAAGWLLMAAHNQPARDWRLWLLTAAAALLVWRTKVHLLWLIAAGVTLGMLGMV